MEKVTTSKKNILAGSIIISALLIFSLSCSDDPDSETPDTNRVTMTGNVFSPPSLTVSAGSTVTWINNDGVAHNVTGDTGLFSSGTLNPGDTFSFTFQTAGTYNYSCTLHPGMNGVIVVSEQVTPGY